TVRHKAITQRRVRFHAAKQGIIDALTKLHEAGQPTAFVVPLGWIGERIQARSDDGVLESSELVLIVAAFRFAEFTGSGLQHLSGGRLSAEIEVSEAALRQRAVEDAVMHFICGDGAVFARRHPTIATAEYAQEARAAFVNDFAADFQGILLAGDAPTQIDINEMNVVREQLLAQARENEAHQLVALRLHVAEGRGDKYANGFPSSHLISHSRMSSGRGAHGRPSDT